jgi:hypothetical protein
MRSTWLEATPRTSDMDSGDFHAEPHPVPAELEPGYIHADPPDLTPAERQGVAIMHRLDDDTYARLSAWIEKHRD